MPTRRQRRRSGAKPAANAKRPAAKRRSKTAPRVKWRSGVTVQFFDGRRSPATVSKAPKNWRKLKNHRS